MKHWISKNYKTLIIAAFLIPIITVAIVSISHVTKWYGISNPVSWAIYLSIGIEIAALSALAAISADMGKKVYFPFAIVTLIQFIGNIFFAYSYIDIDSKSFKDWVDLVSPLVSFMGVEANDFVGHKRFLALFAGGMLPIISLSFLHMLVKFTEEDRLKEETNEPQPKEENINKIDASDLIGEVSRIRLSEEDLKVLEKALLNPPLPNEKLKAAAQRYSDEVREKHTHIKDFSENDEKLKAATLKEESALKDEEILQRTEEKKKQHDALTELMKLDQELGLYDEPFDNPLIKEDNLEDDDWGGLSNEELIGDDEIPTIQDTYEIAKSVEEPPAVVPALSDEEVRDMFMDEWERKYELVEEDEYIPTEEDIIANNELNAIQNAIENETVPEPFATEPEVEKFNIDSSYEPQNNIEVQDHVDDGFWRNHLAEDNDEEGLKKK